MRSLLSALALTAVLVGPPGVDLARAQGTAPADPGAALPEMAPTAIAYRSYTAAEPTERPALEGAGTADLVGKTIVNADGQTLGTVADLAISPGEEVGHAVVDVGGFVDESGIASPLPSASQRFVVVAIDTLAPVEGDADGDLVLAKSRAEVESMTFYEQQDGLWRPAISGT